MPVLLLFINLNTKSNRLECVMYTKVQQHTAHSTQALSKFRILGFCDFENCKGIGGIPIFSVIRKIQAIENQRI